MSRNLTNGGGDVKNIKSLRENVGFTQVKLAEMLNISRTTVTMWETTDAYPRSELLPQIAELLGCSIDDLYDKPQTDSA